MKPLILSMASLLCVAPALADNLQTTVDTGSLTETCAPYDGAAFQINLTSSHIRATVNASFPDIVKSGTSAMFQAGTEYYGKPNGAMISICDNHDKNCVEKDGMISVTTVEKGIVTGTIQFLPTGWGRGSSYTENHTFQVKYTPGRQPCG